MNQALPHWLACTAAAALLLLPACKTTEPETPPAKDATASADAFVGTVKPLFEQRCVWCHRSVKPSAGLNFENRDSLYSPSMRFIVPGKPELSRIYFAVVRPKAHPRVMPGDGWGVTAEQKAALERWILDGAQWPEGAAGTIEVKPFKVEFDDYL